MLADRELLQKLETTQLAPYGQSSAASRGRAYDETEHPYRTAYQRDRDRILHTTAFRRLEYKTQVFVNHEGDHYRTRLTHTLEVAQIARTLARVLRVNQDLTEAIAMAHDLGHTPFGHSGEHVLHDLMAEHGGFNHNAHSLRIVDILEKRYPGFPGLNLTWEVREGIIKHATTYDTPDAVGFEPGRRATIEGQIINVADEIAYNTHDLDDGLRSGLIKPSQLADVPLWSEALRNLGIKGGTISSLDRSIMVRYLVNCEVTDVLTATVARLNDHDPQSVDDIKALPENVIGYSDEMAARNREVQDYLVAHLYRHWRVMRAQEKAGRMLRQMFHAFTAEPQQLPFDVQTRIDGAPLARVVCDYIAGMTDRYALQEHRRMFEPGVRT